MDIGAILYTRYLKGDDSALEEMVKLYGDSLVRFVYCFVKDSCVAEDVVADTFATLIFKRKRFDERAAFKTYLYKIARNKCIDFLRFNRRFVPLSDFENTLYGGDVESNSVLNSNKEILYRCLQKLPRQYSDVLVLIYLEDFSVAEVNKILGKTAKQTYNLLSRAKGQLKTLLINEGIEYEGL